MSVLIRGMEMPTSCDKCIYSAWSNFYQIYACNAVRENEPVLFDGKQTKSTACVRSARADNCPLVHVPEHGDLIDRDALKISTAAPLDGQPYQYIHIDNIKGAPTIIPANESDMDSFIHIFEEDDEEDGMDSFIRIFKD